MYVEEINVPYNIMKTKCDKYSKFTLTRGGSRAAATSKMVRFVIIVNGFQQSGFYRKRSILGVAAALDPALTINKIQKLTHEKHP